MASAPTFERSRSIAKERLRQGEDGIGANARLVIGSAGGEHPHRTDAKIGEKFQGLVFDNVRQRADDHQLTRFCGRQRRDERREAGVFALSKRRLDAGAGIVDDAHAWSVDVAQPFCCPMQVEFDDFGWT